MLINTLPLVHHWMSYHELSDIDGAFCVFCYMQKQIAQFNKHFSAAFAPNPLASSHTDATGTSWREDVILKMPLASVDTLYVCHGKWLDGILKR